MLFIDRLAKVADDSIVQGADPVLDGNSRTLNQDLGTERVYR
jgi:hypothetical protein